jgi:radical SAM protein with 4Fe4S-binding SPASM domain
MNFSHTRKLIRAARQIARANVHRLDVPFKVNFALTYWCQYRCKTCNIWQRKPENELTTDEVLEFVRRTTGISWLDITGGEIFLRNDVGELLDAVVASWKHLLILHFPTNGFLTDRIVRVCERLAVRRGPQVIVTVSIDGDESLNDDIRGIRGGYRQQIETFNALRKIRGIRPVFGMTLSTYNVGRFEETLRACQRDCPGLSVADFHLNAAQLSDHYYGNADLAAILPPKDGVTRELRLYRSMRGFPRTPSEWVESEYLRHLERYLETKQTPMRCHSLRSSCFIDPFGTVFPCITYSRPLGHLRQTGMDLAAIWNAPGTAAVQREIWNGQCPQCWTACEAYQSIAGNLMRRAAPPTPPVPQPSGDLTVTRTISIRKLQ